MVLQTSNRLTIAMMAFLASVAVATLAAAQDLGEEWKSLTAAEWKIVFSAPGLDSTIERHQLRTNVNSGISHEIAFWSDQISSYPKAVLHYMKTNDDSAWRMTPDPRSIGEEGAFEDRAVKFGSLKKDRNRLGRAQWRIFHFDNVNCVGFSQTWGIDIDQRLAGDHMIIGYYCADPGQSLSEDMARAIVAAIDIADDKGRRRQLLGKSAGVFDGLWTGTGQQESGSCRVTIVASTAKLDSVRFELIIRDKKITGRVIDARTSSWSGAHFSVDAPIRGTVSESGEFELQAGKSDLGAELVLQGKLPKEGDRASGEWDTPNCHGTLTLTRKR